MSNTFIEVPINKLMEHTDNVRGYHDDESLKELADSIAENGLLEPLLIHGGVDGTYQIIAGHRRSRAINLLVEDKRWKKTTPIPCMLTDEVLNVGQATVLMLVENCQRLDISPFDEAKGYRKLIDEHGFTQRELATKVGKSSGHITKRLSLLVIDPRLEVLVLAGKVPLDQAYDLSQCDEVDQKRITKKIIEQTGYIGQSLQYDLASALRAKTDRAQSKRFVGKLAKMMIETVAELDGERSGYERLGRYDLDTIDTYEPKRGHVVVCYGKDPTSIEVYRKLTKADITRKEKQREQAEVEREQQAEVAKAERNPWEIWEDDEFDKAEKYNDDRDKYRDAVNNQLASYLPSLPPKDLGKLALSLVATKAMANPAISCGRLGINPITTRDGQDLPSYQWDNSTPLREWIGEDTVRAIAAWVAAQSDFGVVNELGEYAPLRSALEAQGIVEPMQPEPAPEPWFDEVNEVWSTEPRPDEEPEEADETEFDENEDDDAEREEGELGSEADDQVEDVA